ncbi:hypothetical protein MMC11_008754, partial [Xylographa trunciseda]|nr:hypothetical protein [Xylographa trunciseda]
MAREFLSLSPSLTLSCIDADVYAVPLAVGRWQKNKDLGWYAKGDDSQAALDAAAARKEEIRKIKEAEQDALREALGFVVEKRGVGMGMGTGTGANAVVVAEGGEGGLGMNERIGGEEEGGEGKKKKMEEKKRRAGKGEERRHG